MLSICVQRGRIGTTTYYMGKMRVGQLIDSVGYAAELPQWEEMTADEKMQRQPDITRIVNDIVPYIVEDADRFFGSLIIDIYSGFEDVIFESLKDVAMNLPKAYQTDLEDVGFLIMSGKERLIALDGQHRLLGLKIAVRGFNGIPAGVKTTNAMKDLTPHPELSEEEVSVIFVEHKDNMKIRKIFNKVNKYARQTSRGDNIITSDDDVYALIARRLFSEGEPLAPIGKCELVNWKSNTLSQRSKQLTTISSLYTIAETILKDNGFSKNRLPEDDALEAAYDEISRFWQECLNGLEIYQEYMALTMEDRPVSGLREKNLLMKPVAQMALAHVYVFSRRKEVTWSEVVENLNKVDWSFDNDLWFNILLIGSKEKKMITGKESIRAAGLVISYLVMGDHMTQKEIQEVRDIIRNARNSSRAKLPEMVVGSTA